MLTYAQFLLYFTLYSFVGWLCELLFVRQVEHKWINRGFLTGPYLPIYGFGALVAILCIAPLPIDAFWKFILCALLATIAEYAIHVLLEKLFGMRLWDYSQFPLNLHGRVCLFTSLAFAGMALLVIDIVHPPVEALVTQLPAWLLIPAALVLTVILLADLVNAVTTATAFRRDFVIPRLSLHEVHFAINDAMQHLGAARQRRTGSVGRAVTNVLKRFRLRNIQRLSEAFPYLTEKHDK